MRRAVIIGVSVFWVIFCITGFALAATVNVNSNDEITSVDSLEFPGRGIFDVEFYYESYDRISDIAYDFGSSTETWGASDYLAQALDHVYDDTYGIRYENLDGETVGETMYYYTPIGVNSSTGIVYSVWYLKTTGRWTLMSQSHDSGTTDTLNYFAVFSQVPIPGAVWLLGSGLIGIVGIRRKLKG